MRIECEVIYDQEENDNGNLQDCVRLECPRCGHSVTSWGTSEASIKRCLVLLREECQMEESNFYVAEDD